MILLVEDDEDVREMLRMYLEGKGHTVLEAADGAKALELLAQARPRLMILDLIMPVMDGWAVIAEMQARGFGDVPVCVISAFGDQGPVEAVGSLRKPFEITELEQMVARYCPPPG